MNEDRYYLLPIHLLEGFVSRVTGKKIFTFVYRKDRKVSEAQIVNVSMDAEITTLKREFARLLDELRATKDKMEVSAYGVSEFITYLYIRTGQRRDYFRESAEF